MRSNFMKYLDKMDEHIYADTVDDKIEVLEEEVRVVQPKPKPKAKKTIKRNASVNLVEKRMRTKLNDIGLNDKAINEVISFVLNDVQNVSGLKTKKSQPQQVPRKHAPRQQAPLQEAPLSNTLMGRAGSILDGLPEQESFKPMIAENQGGTQGDNRFGQGEQPHVKESFDMGKVSDHASSLL